MHLSTLMFSIPLWIASSIRVDSFVNNSLSHTRFRPLGFMWHCQRQVQTEAALITLYMINSKIRLFFMKRGNQHQIMTSQENNWVVVWLGIVV
jgi:hypothetical protein